MSNGELLSQEEIDALLKQARRGGEEEGNTEGNSQDEEVLSATERDALGEIGNISFGSSATALSTILRQKVEITTPVVSLILRDRLAEEFPDPYVAVRVMFTEGLSGLNLLVLNIRDALIIADIMMGGKGEVDEGRELTELHLSAVQEAMNQMMGSAATAMATVFRKTVNISPPVVSLMNMTHEEVEITEDRYLVKVAFQMRIGTLVDSTIMQLLPLSLARQMYGDLIKGTALQQPESASALPTDLPPAAGTGQRQPLPQADHQHDEPLSEAVQVSERVRKEPAESGSNTGMSSSPSAPSSPEPAYSVQPVEFSPLPVGTPSAGQHNLSLLLDIPLKITVELGRTQMLIQEVLELTNGSIIELDKLAGEPVDVFANQKLIARGEVVVIEENFGVRITDILSAKDRLTRLND